MSTAARGNGGVEYMIFFFEIKRLNQPSKLLLP